MTKLISKYTLLLIFSAFLLTGCATSKRNGKIKAGKPIPCPMKDC